MLIFTLAENLRYLLADDRCRRPARRCIIRGCQQADSHQRRYQRKFRATYEFSEVLRYDSTPSW